MNKTLAKLKIAFPELSNDFLLLLAERAKAKKLSDEQLHKAILHVIDTCKYPRPTIASFLSVIEPVKLYTYREMMKLHANQKDIFKHYRCVRINNKPHWVAKEDGVMR